MSWTSDHCPCCGSSALVDINGLTKCCDCGTEEMEDGSYLQGPDEMWPPRRGENHD